MEGHSQPSRPRVGPCGAAAVAKSTAGPGEGSITIFGMRAAYPPVRSKWKEVDTRVQRNVEFIRHDMLNRRVRINCLETQKLTWAKPERFNGKSGGYQRTT